MANIEQLRKQLDEVNADMLSLINERATLVQQIGELKSKQSMKRFDPVRERDMLDQITAQNDGPFQNATIEHIFKEIFKAGLELQEDDHRKALLVSRKKKQIGRASCREREKNSVGAVAVKNKEE